ncbi:hrp65 protein-like isoform X1 [Euwallacea fornicatus]|uniref:hrp65 protein-like isoform X1 n=2 Tax=Euwallacea fornicatus TaxID=995702 RepID=UPI003390528F
MAEQPEIKNVVKQEGSEENREPSGNSNFGGPQRRGRGGSRFSGGRGGGNQNFSGEMSEQPLEIEPPAGLKQENVDQIGNDGGPNFGGMRRGRGGGSRFSNGPGHQRGGFRNRGPGGDRNDLNSNHQEFRGRGRGRGGFRGGRGGGEGGRGGNQDDLGDGEGGGFRRGPIDKVADRISSFQGPTFDLPPIDVHEKKFNGRNRLYLGNISNEVNDEDLAELFKPYGETAEIFLNKEKNFGFIKLDYHANAEKAKRELDGTMLKGRTLKIRFAPNSATIKVKNLTPYVTNELLYFAFSPFGEIEKAHVGVDERGKPTGEGYIHFARKFSATTAIKKCSEGCYFLSTSLQPVIVEAFEVVDDIDGYSDKNINRKHPEFLKEREHPPRLAHLNSFEFEYGQRWKALFELHQQKEEALKKELQLEKEKLIAQMEYAKYEHETELLRNQLRARELDKERQKREWEMKERMAEEERVRQEDVMRRQQEELEARMMASQEDMRRRQQENNLFLQAHNLDSLLDQQEQAFDQPSYGGVNDNMGGGVDMEPKQFMSSYERHNRYEGREGQGRASNAGRGHWVSDNRRAGNQDDYQSKRRRF